MRRLLPVLVLGPLLIALPASSEERPAVPAEAAGQADPEGAPEKPAEKVHKAHGLYDESAQFRKERALGVGLEIDPVSVLPAA